MNIPPFLALQDIRRLQRTVDLQIPKLPFFRVIKEIMQKLKQDYRIQSLAVDALRVGFHLFLMEYQWQSFIIDALIIVQMILGGFRDVFDKSLL